VPIRCFSTVHLLADYEPAGYPCEWVVRAVGRGVGRSATLVAEYAAGNPCRQLG
jgi:hypothetical protein